MVVVSPQARSKNVVFELYFQVIFTEIQLLGFFYQQHSQLFINAERAVFVGFGEGALSHHFSYAQMIHFGLIGLQANDGIA